MASTFALASLRHLPCYVLTSGNLYPLPQGPLAGSGALWEAMHRQALERRP
jgi:hypothetical protein